jgi:uncharacterized damage-inducible protein DinB
MDRIGRPDACEANAYFTGYIEAVPGEDLLTGLRDALVHARSVVEATPSDQEDHRYADGKWSIKQVLQHLTDTERVFVFRAMSFARGERQALPGFDENDYAELSDPSHRTLADVLEEHEAVRHATIAFFKGLPATALTRSGIANGDRISVRALGWTLVGHAEHHLNIIEQRYR